MTRHLGWNKFSGQSFRYRHDDMFQIFCLEVMCQLECMSIHTHKNWYLYILFNNNIGIISVSTNPWTSIVKTYQNWETWWPSETCLVLQLGLSWLFGTYVLLTFISLCSFLMATLTFFNPSWKMIHLYLTLSPPFVVCPQKIQRTPTSPTEILSPSHPVSYVDVCGPFVGRNEEQLLTPTEETQQG